MYVRDALRQHHNLNHLVIYLHSNNIGKNI